MDYTVELRGYTLEYIDETHTYLVDGIIVPSVSEVLKTRFGNKYDGIDRQTLMEAARKGTEVHEAIEAYYQRREKSDLPEVRNFKFLQKTYGFGVIGNEIPIIIFDDGIPVCAGRLDLVLRMDGKMGLADIKRTSSLDKEYLACQLNLYRIGFQQSYGYDIEFLKGVHLREDVRKFVDIPVNEGLAWELIYERRQKDE